MVDIAILVQARMTSSRFPGKVLAPLRGRPVIAHVIDRVRRVRNAAKVILATSHESSDDPLALYAETCLGIEVFRGDLRNVVDRFQSCLRGASCPWFVRVCGDSPLIDPELISLMMEMTEGDGTLDLITNVAVRTFPPGQSVEVIRTAPFLELDAAALAPDEQEHVTMHYYKHQARYGIRQIRSGDPSIAGLRMVVDSFEDLKALDELLEGTPGLDTTFGRFAECCE